MKENKWKTIRGTGLMLLLIGLCILLATHLVFAQSSNVVIIGGTTLDTSNPCVEGSNAANQMDWVIGGCLPVTGADLAGITFTAMDPSAVSAASLQPYDTAVLNVASYAMACNTGTLLATQKTDLVNFVGAGKKLIIFDSECYQSPVDYSWLPYPFTTVNPGATGYTGCPLTIVEENTLSSSNPLSPYYIDAVSLGNNTDAVCDMNVMTTYDNNWCLDMSGTNIISIWGPVHTYANYPSGTDTGLIIYNGLDQNYQAMLGDTWLRKIWVQELKQPFNPSGLPCRIKVIGITLEPKTATNVVGEDHTVTATVTDLLGNPQPGILVTFSVISGPNTGASGTCSPSDCKTDANGQVSFTYTGATGAGGVGTDKIHGCFMKASDKQPTCDEVTKDWTPPVNLPPDCTKAVSISEIWPPNHKLVSIAILGVTDPDGDPVTISITKITQDEPVNGLGDGDTAPDGFGIGASTAMVRAERSGKGNGRVYVISFTANDGKSGTCDGSVSVCVPHDQKPEHVCIDDGQNYDSTKP